MSFFNGIDHLDIKNGSFSVMRNVVYLKGDFDNLSPHSDENAAFHDSHLPEFIQIKEGSFRVVRFIRRKGSSRLFYEGPDIPITNFGEDPTTKEAAIKRILAYLISGVKHVEISGGTFALQTTKTLASPFRGPFYAPQESTIHKKKATREPKNIHIHGASFVESTILIDSSDAFDSDHYGEFTDVVGLVDNTKIGFKGIPKNYLPGLSLFPGCRKMEILGGDFNITLTDLVFLDDEDNTDRFEPMEDNSLPQSRFPPSFNNGASQAIPVTQTSINLTNVINQQSTIVVGGDNYSGNIDKSIVGGKGNSNNVTNNRGLGQENKNYDDDPLDGYARERRGAQDQDRGRGRGGVNDQDQPEEDDRRHENRRYDARERAGADNRGHAEEDDGQHTHGGGGDMINDGDQPEEDDGHHNDGQNGDKQYHARERGGAEDGGQPEEDGDQNEDDGENKDDGQNKDDGDNEDDGENGDDGQNEEDGENEDDGQNEDDGENEDDGQNEDDGENEDDGQNEDDGENEDDGQNEDGGENEDDGQNEDGGENEDDRQNGDEGENDGDENEDDGDGLGDYPDEITDRVDWA